MKLLVGSTALKRWYPEFREPNDVDYFSETPIEGAETFFHPVLPLVFPNYECTATPSELYTIKVSHSFWALRNGSWHKHMADIKWLQETGGVGPLAPVFVPHIYKALYPVWEERYGKKKGSLNVEPEEFFNSNVVRVYEHDSIHASVAYGDRPLFEKVLKDGHAVMVDKAKFDALDLETKYRLVREEVYATALERYVIPSNYTFSPRAAYAKALEKTITSFWRGDWALFVVLHYKDLYRPDRDYVQHHRDNADRLIKL